MASKILEVGDRVEYTLSNGTLREVFIGEVIGKHAYMGSARVRVQHADQRVIEISTAMVEVTDHKGPTTPSPLPPWLSLAPH